MFRATHHVRRIIDRVTPHMPVPGVLLSAVLAVVVGALVPMHLPLAPSGAVGQEPAADATPGDGPAAVELTLAARQQQVAERFQRLEQLLIRLAEVEATENPERAALLRRAAKQSRESFILDRLSAASEALSGAQYQEAIDAQQAANENLASLLKLLLTEDRSERIREEKERIANWIKDLKREERKQRATRARAENGAELEAISEEQEDILENAAELQREMAEDNEPASGSQPRSQESQRAPASPSSSEKPESESSESEDSESGNSESGEPQSPDEDGDDPTPEEMDGDDAVEKAQQELKEAEARLAEAKQKAEAAENDSEASDEARAEAAEALEKAQQERDAKQDALENAKQQQAEKEAAADETPSSQNGEQSPSSPSPSEQSQQGENQQGESQQGQSQQGQSQQQQQPQTPQQQAEQKLQQAIEKMKQAQQELEQAKREEATERQREAERNLREAIDELEKILRQLREEEMQRELARLESRLRKMAQMQSEVLDQTRELAAVPASDRTRQTDLQAGKLAAQEREIVLEADRAMLLLREEGSSVAFPEVVQQIRGDMRTVADRLAQTEIDGITQGIQEDILAALEEMIAALQKAQRDLEKQQQQQQTPQQQMGQPGEQPLVESLAELKLIRTMQQRIKQTTDRYAEMIEQSQQTPDPEFLDLLQNLADRQNRLSTITRDIVMQRNR